MSRSYTAIIYFHGIGTQRRYEEISRLLDAVDQFTISQDAETIGYPRGQKVKFETSRTKNGTSENEPISYISFHRRVEIPEARKQTAKKAGHRKPSPFRGSFRLYEGYWSSIIAKGLPSRTVLRWIVGRIGNPIRSIMAPWRAHQRLKLGYLFRLEQEDPKGGNLHKSAYRQLAECYIAFESWSARRKYVKGSFSQFRNQYLRTAKIGERNDFAFIQKLADKWYKKFVFSQMRIFTVMMTLLVGLFGAVSFALYSIAPLIANKTLDLPYVGKIIGWMPTQPKLLTACIILPILLAGNYLLAKFLRNFASDVVFWTAREGRSDLFEMRKKILNQAVNNLEHVLKDPACRRVVVIGHSLGSSIGYQALLEIGRRREALGKQTPEAKAAYPYEKISHFITAGSPIETLHYFFELTDSKQHRYNRIANKIKGSIEDAPFTFRRDNVIKWINLYALADPISSRLFAPGRTKLPSIEEIEIVNQFEPNVALAHSGYFTATPSVARIHDAIMLNDNLQTDRGPLYSFTKPLARFAVRTFHILMFFCAWSLFFSALMFWAGQSVYMNRGLAAFVIAIGLSLALWVFMRIMSSLFPLTVAKQAAKRMALNKERNPV